MTTQNPVYASQAKPWLKYYAQKYIDQTLPTLSAFDYVCNRNRNHLNDTALDYYGRKFTYADLIVNVKKTAAALRGVGVKKGDIVTVVSVMTPEVIALFYAADMVGATLNLVDPRYSVEGIHEYIEEVDSHLLVCLNVVYERCRQAAKRTNVEKVIVLSPADSLPPVMAVGYKLTTPDKNKYASNVIRWKQFIKGGEGQSTAAEPYDPDHACVVVHTGGTTGSPKGVMLTDNCFNALAQQFRAYDKLFHRGQKLMNIMPPFIAYGYACGVHLPLVLGFTVIIIPNLDPAKLGSLVLKYKPEHMFGVPAHYQQLAADPKLRDKDLSFILNYAAGGDAIARGAEQTVNDFLAAHGETAMILRRHPDGRIWVHTGDIGYLDEDGFVYLDSRIKRLIIRHDGFKVFPSMIENVVSRHPAVHQCSVVGCTDKDHVQGRLPFVYIVLKADTTAKKKQVIRELERMCAEELPEYVQPVAYKFISSMPMTPVGKVDYRQLEADISPRDY